jgi:hypothetical protein
MFFVKRFRIPNPMEGGIILAEGGPTFKEQIENTTKVELHRETTYRYRTAGSKDIVLVTSSYCLHPYRVRQ